MDLLIFKNMYFFLKDSHEYFVMNMKNLNVPEMKDIHLWAAATMPNL